MYARTGVKTNSDCEAAQMTARAESTFFLLRVPEQLRLSTALCSLISIAYAYLYVS